MHSYTLSLKTLFEKNADPIKAAPMKKYMRNQFEYLGIKSPQGVILLREHIKEHGLPPLDKLDMIVRELWGLPRREFQYTALGLMSKLETKVDENFITTIEYLIITKSWWDTVDTLAGHSVGAQFKRFPKVKEKYLKKMAQVR
ncbi:MAG: DNA alkylation repair protein [Anaerolineales bacterium]|nr:DNA alkylation repair protein [Anaerolineales bacterium]